MLKEIRIGNITYLNGIIPFTFFYVRDKIKEKAKGVFL